MRQIVNGYFYKIAIGVGLVVLVGLVAADIWLWQSDDNSGSGATSDQETPGGTTVPGLPTRNSGGESSGASANDQVILEIEREGDETKSGLIAGDGASISDSINLETTGSSPGSSISDGASVGDSVETVVEQAPPPPSGGGGPKEDASFGDSADLVVKDSEGNIKSQETVK